MNNPTLEYCLSKLITMANSANDRRIAGNPPSAQSLRIIDNYGNAIKDRFDNEYVSKIVDGLISVSQCGHFNPNKDHLYNKTNPQDSRSSILKGGE